jgi:succinate dehydrogenase/fumarate reductase flavoprotein subunit
VLTQDQHKVKGLYAVGNDAASIMGGNYPGAGITLGPALTFGYVVGQVLAKGDVLEPAIKPREALAA